MMKRRVASWTDDPTECASVKVRRKIRHFTVKNLSIEFPKGLFRILTNILGYLNCVHDGCRKC